jgi:hypothetical protein
MLRAFLEKFEDMEFAHLIEILGCLLVGMIVSCSWRLNKVGMYEVNSSGRATIIIADKEIRCQGSHGNLKPHDNRPPRISSSNRTHSLTNLNIKALFEGQYRAEEL